MKYTILQTLRFRAVDIWFPIKMGLRKDISLKAAVLFSLAQLIRNKKLYYRTAQRQYLRLL